jgi:hypothetical protein
MGRISWAAIKYVKRDIYTFFRSHSCQHQHLDESKVGKHSNDQQPLMYRQVGVEDDLICSSEVAGSIVIECSEAPQHGYKLTEVSQL